MRLSGYAVAITVSIGVVLSATPASAQLDFTWSPVVPEIGETVVFTLTGVTGTIETATWTMGGIGCDGASATQICGPLPPWSGEDCSQFSFKYASAGPKSVSVILDLAGGGNDSAGPLTVNLANSGSCDVVTPSISYRPSNPDIGENVLFTINGVPADIDKASWSMGATGCDGADPTPECFPSLWNDCKSQAFKYASGGDKTVGLTVEVGSNTFTADPVVLTVAWSGSCSGGVGCTNVLLEPGFEGGSGSAWSENSSNGYFLITMNRPRSGSFSAWLGGIDNEVSSVWQVPPIDALATSATLSYWYWIESEDICEYDKGGVTVNGLLARGHDFDLCLSTNTSGYVQSEIVDLLPYAGTTPEILFFTTTDSSDVSSLYIDDAILEVCVPGIPGDQVFSDGFESGDVSAWSSTVP